MPEIVRIAGIVITMYWEDHEPSHVHARSGNTKGCFNIKTGEMIEGNCTANTQKLVKDWVLSHSNELQMQWDTQNIHKI